MQKHKKIELLLKKQFNALFSEKNKMATTVYDISIGFMTALPATGRLTFTLAYNQNNQHNQNNQELTHADVLRIITPHVLEKLGGQEGDWMIATHPPTEDHHYMYSFEWQALDNQARSCPIMRTITYRPHRHHMVIDMR